MGLSWNEFFKARRRIQIFQRVAGIPFAFGFVACETAVLSLPIFDPSRLIFGMDPLVVVGISTISGTALSYFAGMALTGYVWRKVRPDLFSSMNEKQKSFYGRIAHYRANFPPNPTQINFSFDYYGEKIRSIADYRQWLRRQSKMKADREFKI